MTPPRGHRIILVQDDESLARLIIYVLTKSGYEVEHLPDGRAALGLVARPEAADLLVLAYLMPYANALTVIRKLRNYAVWNRVPIICVTETSYEDTMMLGLRIQSDAYLEKPFRPSELVDTAARLITRAREKLGEPQP